MYIKELDCPELGLNVTLLDAYRNSTKRGLEMIDFHNTIWDEDIQPITDTLRRLGVQQFTISCRTTGLIDTLAKFQALSVIVKGITKVNYIASWGPEETDAVLLEVLPTEAD